MPDPRFYEALGPASLAELAQLTGAALADPALGARTVDGVAPLGSAGPSELAYLGDRRYAPELDRTHAAACFIRSNDSGRAPAGCTVLVTSEPQAAYARAAERLHRPRRHPADTAAVHPQAELEAGVVLGHGVVIGPGARIGADTVIGANTVIGPGVAIGRRCRIGANAVIGFALIGDRVSILSNATVGESGFGVANIGETLLDIPQLGRTILQDGVSIGSGTCIDRGAWDDTVVGENTKIDNLVQIAHNVHIGRNCVIAAHTGISGSVTVGDGAMFGGRAGIADHLNIGAGARVGAAAGVIKDIPPGETWAGYPARPIQTWLREAAVVSRAARRGGHGLRGAEGDE